MSKRKIGTIYNKPIVTGDKNLVTKNEIHESTLKGEDSVEYNRWYYMLDSDKLKTDFNFTDDYGAIPNEIKDIIALYDISYFIFMLKPSEFNTYDYRYCKSSGTLSQFSAWELRRKPCFVISDELPFVADIGEGYNLVIKGSLEERLKALAELSSDTSEYLHYLDYIIPLSKEEFESKIPKEIDYKDFINQL